MKVDKYYLYIKEWYGWRLEGVHQKSRSCSQSLNNTYINLYMYGFFLLFKGTPI